MINDRTFQSVPAKLTRTGLAFGLALTFATAAHAQPASAPPAQAANEDAGQRFKRGVELYQDHDFRAAILEFQRAYQIAPNFRVLYNIGQAYFEVQDYVAAEDAFTRYLRDGGGDVPADRVEEVKGLLEKLKARIATLELTANVEGAQISIDDVERGTTPLPGPIRISAGQRKLTITKEGFTSISRSLSMTGGDVMKESFTLVPVNAKATTPDEPASSGPGTPFWVLLSTTGALGVGAAIAGGLAVAKNSEHQDLLKTPGVSLSDLEESADELRPRTIATDILLGATGAAAVTTLILGIAAATSGPEKPATAQVHLLIGPTFLGFEQAF